jgi:hypothetical protein
MELVGIASSVSLYQHIRTGSDGTLQKCEEILKRNESVLRLVEEVGNASALVVDWDNPDLDDQRPHQRRVYRELVPEIYRCLHLLCTISNEKLGSFYSRLLRAI